MMPLPPLGDLFDKPSAYPCKYGLCKRRIAEVAVTLSDTWHYKLNQHMYLSVTPPYDRIRQ